MFKHDKKLPGDVDTASNKDFGVTEDSKLYFDLSTPDKSFDAPNPTLPSFNDPHRQGIQHQ